MSNELPKNVWESILSLPYATCEFTLRAEEEMRLPQFKGSTIRGMFGSGLKAAVCLNETLREAPSCRGCLLISCCPYPLTFEVNVPKEIQHQLHVGGDAPTPFIIEPSAAVNDCIRKNELLTFRMTLFGYAVKLFPYYILVFRFMGKRFGLGKRSPNTLSPGSQGRFSLREVRQEATTLFQEQEGIIRLPVPHNLFLEPQQSSRCAITFETPANLHPRIYQQGEGFNLAEFIKHLHRRNRQLRALFHAPQLQSESVEPAYEHLEVFLRAADEITVTGVETLRREQIMRWSNRQQQKAPMRGITGTLHLTGPVSRILPLLRAAEIFHIGKWSAFGFGKIRVEEFV